MDEFNGSGSWPEAISSESYVPRQGVVRTQRQWSRVNRQPTTGVVGRSITIVSGEAWRCRADESAVAKEFKSLVRKWQRETMLLSNPNEIHMHVAYQRIIGMGEQVLPLIFDELQSAGGHWFWALRAITGKNPVTKAMWGDVAAMRKAWMQWWQDRNQEHGNSTKKVGSGQL